MHKTKVNLRRAFFAKQLCLAGLCLEEIKRLLRAQLTRTHLLDALVSKALIVRIMEYQAKLQYDSALLREALFGFWWRTVTGRLLVALTVSLFGFVYCWVNGDRSWLIGVLGAVLVSGVGMIMAVYFVHLANMKRKIKNMGTPEATFTASDSSFSVASGAGSSTMPWASVTEVWQFKRCWLLLFSKAQFITVPLSNVPEEMREFILQRVTAAGGKIDG